MFDRKSDYLIVLRERESRLHSCVGESHRQHGEGDSGYTQHSKETSPGNDRPDKRMQTSLSGIDTAELLLSSVHENEYNRGALCGSFACRDLWRVGQVTGRSTPTANKESL